MYQLNVCPTCGGNLNKKKAVTRKIDGEIWYFDAEVCAKVFDGTGSFLDLLSNHPFYSTW